MAGTDTSEWGPGAVLIPGPQGEPGPAGPPPNLVVGSVTKAIDPAVTITGTTPNYIINFQLPQGNLGPKGDPGAKGDKGDTGASGVVQSLAAGSGISVKLTDPANPQVSITADVLNEIAAKVAEVLVGTGLQRDVTTPTKPVISLGTDTQATLALVGTIASGAANPTISDIEDGSWRVWHNTDLDECRLWVNIGDVLRSVTLT